MIRSHQPLSGLGSGQWTSVLSSESDTDWWSVAGAESGIESFARAIGPSLSWRPLNEQPSILRSLTDDPPYR